MNRAIVYIHGKGGNASEAEHFKALFEHYDIIGFDYGAQLPWEAKEEFPLFFRPYFEKYEAVSVIANSIGAYFAMNALQSAPIQKALFISPIVNMEKLISDMMIWANVTEEELRDRKEIPTAFGETLSWNYLCYVRKNPITWNVPTNILYGAKDHLTPYETMSAFAAQNGATLTVMENGEHWFHTDEQMAFLDNWVRRYL